MCVFFFFKQKTAYEMRISDWSSDACSSDLHVDTVAPGGDIEQRDGIAAGLPSIELGIEGLPGPPVGVIGEEGFAVDEVAQCTGLAAQVTDHVPEIDAMPPVGMTDPHTRRGHYPVWTEEELDGIVKKLRVEGAADEGAEKGR